MYLPQESNTDQGQRRLQEKVRRLETRRRSGILGPWQPLAPLIQADFFDAFGAFPDRQCEYRTDGDRAFLRGMLECSTDDATDMLAGLVAAGIAPSRPEVTRGFVPLSFNNMPLTGSSITPGFTVSFNDVGSTGDVMFLEESDPKLVDYTVDPIAYKTPGPGVFGGASSGDLFSLDGLWWWIT